MKVFKMLILLIFIISIYLWIYPITINNYFDIDLIFILLGSTSLILLEYIESNKIDILDFDKHGYKFGILFSLLKLIALPNGILSNINILVRPFIYGLIISYLFKWIRIELDKNKENQNVCEFLSIYKLTPTEIDVLELVMNRLPNKEIADQMHISLSTVKKHIQNSFRKIDVNNRNELIELFNSKRWWEI